MVLSTWIVRRCDIGTIYVESYMFVTPVRDLMKLGKTWSRKLEGITMTNKRYHMVIKKTTNHYSTIHIANSKVHKPIHWAHQFRRRMVHFKIRMVLLLPLQIMEWTDEAKQELHRQRKWDSRRANGEWIWWSLKEQKSYLWSNYTTIHHGQGCDELMYRYCGKTTVSMMDQSSYTRKCRWWSDTSTLQAQ